MTVSEAIARPVRTALQIGAVAAVVEFVDTALHDMSDRTYTASIALGTILLSLVQAAVENRTGKALLRQVPPRKVPAVDEGSAELWIIAGCMVVVSLVLLFGSPVR